MTIYLARPGFIFFMALSYTAIVDMVKPVHAPGFVV
jgi:hypothetical protein